MLFKFKPFEISTVWEFTDPDTQYKYSARNLKELVQNIVGYRAQNKLAPIEQLDAVIENYLCKLPQNCGKCRYVGKLKRGFLTYLKGGITLVTNLWMDKTVSQEEADRRAEICIKCPLNVFPDKGPFVKWTDEIAKASIGDKKSKWYDLLGTCAACTCTLKAKTWYPGPFDLTPKEEMLMRSVKDCWQVEK